MNELEAMEILEEVKELDDSMYQYNPKYMEALETVLTLTRNLHNFMRGLYEEHFLGEETYTSKEVYDMINKEVFEIENKGDTDENKGIINLDLKYSETKQDLSCLAELRNE